MIFIALWLGIGIGLGYLDMLLSSCMSDLYQGKTARRMMCILHLTYGQAFVTAPVVYSAVLKMMEANDILWNRLYFYVAGAGLLLLLSLIFMSGITTWINRYMEVTLQASFGAYALSFLFFGVMISRLVMSFVKISSEDYLTISGIVAGVSILAALPVKSPVVMGVAIFVCGLFYGAMIPCILSLVSSHIPQNPMLVTTLVMLSFYLGQAIGPAMTGKDTQWYI